MSPLYQGFGRIFQFSNSLPFLKASTQSPSTPLFLRSLRRAVGGRCIMHPPMLPASTGDGVHPQEVCTEHVWSIFFPSGNSRSIASTNTLTQVPDYLATEESKDLRSKSSKNPCPPCCCDQRVQLHPLGEMHCKELRWLCP